MSKNQSENVNQLLYLFYDLTEEEIIDVNRKISFIESDITILEMMNEIRDLVKHNKDSIHNRTKVVEDYFLTESALQTILEEKSFTTSYHYEGYKAEFRRSFLESLREKRKEIDEYLDSAEFKNTLIKKEAKKNVGTFHEINEEAFIFELEKYFGSKSDQKLEILLTQDDSAYLDVFFEEEKTFYQKVEQDKLLTITNKIFGFKPDIIHYNTELKKVYFLEFY